VLQRAERIFPYGEPGLTDRLTQILTSEGINIATGVDITEVRVKDGKKVVVFNLDGSAQEISADEILVAAGKRANTEKLSLDAAGIDLDERGAIVVDEHYATSNPLVYAVGDVAALPLRQETTAGKEGTIAAGNALADGSGSVDYDSVPYAIFTDPQFAGVGMTEEEQMRRTKVCACRTISLEHVPKAGILRQSEGLIKMGIDPKTKEILGVHMVGPHAAEVMAEGMMLIKNKNTIDDVTASVPMFPTMSEAMKAVALSFTKDISKISCCV
jgi:mercuric reductase